jgi:hypothetical protein
LIKINKIDKSSARVTKKRIGLNKIRNERIGITMDASEIKKNHEGLLWTII